MDCCSGLTIMQLGFTRYGERRTWCFTTTFPYQYFRPHSELFRTPGVKHGFIIFINLHSIVGYYDAGAYGSIAAALSYTVISNPFCY